MTPFDRLLLLDTARAAAPPEPLLAMVLAFLCGMGATALHRWSAHARTVAPALSAALALLPVITAMVMIAIGDSLARAFSLVGALAIIRFRTPLSSPWDMAFVFLSLGVGIAAGVGRPEVGGLALGVSALATAILGVLPLTAPAAAPVTVRAELAAWQVGEAALKPTLDAHTRERSLTEARSLRYGETLVLTWRVHLAASATAEGLVRALSAIEGVERVTLVQGEAEPDPR